MPISTLPDFIQALISSSVGSLIGTAIKLLRQPPTSLPRWLGESFIRISIGTFAGGICSEWLHFGPWVASSVAAMGAYLSDEIIRAVDRNGRRIKNINPPMPFEKDQGEDHGS